MKNLALLISVIVCLASFHPKEEHRTLAIGEKAPDFKLPATDGKQYSLSSFADADILVIIFTCNHCPTAQAYEDRIIQLVNDYKNKKVSVVAIMPNDPRSVQLSELGYTDLGDSFEEMKIRATEKKFNFPYLYDGDHETTANAYGPVATPHVFIFDKERKLRYQGRIDDVEKPTKTPENFDTRNAIDALLANKPVPVETTKVFGCSIKWAEKEDLNKIADEEWSKEPVELDTINVTGVKDLVKNNTDKIRLINIWATWCGPCIVEYPQFITINRMYRGRDFEFISISADDADKKEKALRFLKQKNSAVKNYIFTGENKYKLIDAIDPKWQGALPYTILVEPGGKIVYSKLGAIKSAELKKIIVENKYIGRYY
ncbi:MAG: redoxin family protein [Chitinophagaceae bacterium]